MKIMKIYDLIDPKEMSARPEKLPDYRRVEEKVEQTIQPTSSNVFVSNSNTNGSKKSWLSFISRA